MQIYKAKDFFQIAIKTCYFHTWTKTIQKMKVGDQSTFIQVNFEPCEEIKFFHQFKRMSKLSEKAFMFSSAHRQKLSNRPGQRTIRS